MTQRLIRIFLACLAAFSLVLFDGAALPVAACPNSDANSCSNSYGITESLIGPAGLLNPQSGSYSLLGAEGGDIGVGNSSSSNYQTQSGFNTPSEPRLAFSITSSSANLGVLSSSVAKTATGAFTVLNYTSYGYIVQVSGGSLASNNHTITALSSPTASSTSHDQFGINLVANTAPATFGTNPVQVPSGNFSYGAAATNYNTTNLYKYVSGDTIAQSTKTSGETDYTISFIANIAPLTPGGTYSTNLVLICVGTY